MELIGCGERTVLTLLMKKFGRACEYKTQMLLKDLVAPELVDSLSNRQMKESVDIVVYPLFNKPIVFRVQDEHHNTTRMSVIDDVQSYILQNEGYDVVDILNYECPEIWNEKVNDKSKKELEDAINIYMGSSD